MMNIPSIEYGGSALGAYSLQAFPFSKMSCDAGGTRRNGLESAQRPGQDFSRVRMQRSDFCAGIATTLAYMPTGEFISFERISSDLPKNDRPTELERARALAATIESVREAEKQRIARDLHDELGQQLSGLKMDLAALLGEIDVIGIPQSAVSRIGEIQRAIDRAVSSVRRIAAGLRPALLDDLGLLPALEWLIDDFRERSGIRATLHDRTSDIEFNDLASTALFRIVQEALTNVARHAEDATEVAVTLAFEGAVFVQTISDNGVASSTPSPSCSDVRPSGLAGVRERVRQLGGTVYIGRTFEHGFRVEVSVPARAVRRTRGDDSRCKDN